MSKTVAVSGKFSEDECQQIENYAEIHGMNKSQVVHELVMNGIKLKPQNEKGVRSIGLYFTDNFAYFWKGNTYRGILTGDEVSIKFGGEWMNYHLSELPAKVVD